MRHYLKRALILQTNTYFVTLNILSKRRARSTLIPKEAPGLMAAHTTSKILPTITWTGKIQDPFNKRHLIFISELTPCIIILYQISHNNCNKCYKSNTEGRAVSKETHPKVKAIERGMKVVSGSQSVHLQGHLYQEESQENKLRQVCQGKYSGCKAINSFAGVWLVSRIYSCISLAECIFIVCNSFHIVILNVTLC